MSTKKDLRSNSIGDLNEWKKTSTGISGKSTLAQFKVEFFTNDIVRIYVTQQNEFNNFSYAVIANPEVVQFDIFESEEKILLNTPTFQVTILKQPLCFSFHKKSGEVINEDDKSLGIRWHGEQPSVYKKIQEDEKFIGLGEKNGPLDRRGRGYVNWNTDTFAYSPDADPLYVSIPFYMGVHHQLVYGIFFDNSARTQFNFGASNDRFASFSADCGDINYYFINGDSVATILKSYTHLTGRMPLPPKWSIGYQQCRYSYYPEHEVINIAENFRKRDFPGDAIVLDIHYMDAYKIFTWDKVKFPNPKEMITKVKELGFHVVVICDPGIKIEENYEPYDSGKRENIFVKYPDGSDYTGAVWPGPCHFPDFTNPNTREWWAQRFKDYVELGVEGFWNDMNEISTWGNMLPDLLEFEMDGEKGSTREVRNLYGMLMAKSTYEGAKKLMSNKRPFNLTRAGFAGVQRYAAVWTGDNVAYDAHMMAGIRLVNSMGLSGLAFTGYDIGGFAGNADEKLFARWISIGAFSPFFRGHSMINSRDSEPWSYGEKVEEISRNYIKLRYKLLPYLYSLFYETSQTGMPINRSLAIDYTHDDLIYDPQYHNQYLFGPSVLVVPVESDKELVKTYLPEGTWFEMFTDKRHQGKSEIISECPIDQIPLYVKESSIIPMRQKSGETTLDQGDVLEIHLYNGNQNNQFLFYEDDGVSFDYKNEIYAKRILEFKPSVNCLLIHPQSGGFDSTFKTLTIFFHGFENLKSVSVKGISHEVYKKEYRFIQPISNFDPLGTIPKGPKISSLGFIEIDYSKNQMEICW